MRVVGTHGPSVYFYSRMYFFFSIGFFGLLPPHPPTNRFSPDLLPLGLAFLEIPQPILRYHQHNPVVSPQWRQKLQYCSKVHRKLKSQLLTNKYDEMHWAKQINQAKSLSRLIMKKTLPNLKRRHSLHENRDLEILAAIKLWLVHSSCNMSYIWLVLTNV